MSVPLDRLYNFLHNLCNRDIIIYGFKPHGSKKLTDLTPLFDTPTTWIHGHTTMCLILHDQEPLQFDLYSADQIMSVLTQMPGQTYHAEMLEQLSRMHIRAVTSFPYNGYDMTMLCHSEKNSTEVAKYQAAGFVPVYYWSHALIARDWFRFAQHDLVLENKNIQQDFLIYNRAWSGSREYRLKFAELLYSYELINYCKTSFCAVDSGQHYSNHIYKNPNFQISTNLESKFLANSHLSSASADYNNGDYASTGIEVVLETLFDDQRNHLTEKILRPIACGMPFIACATPNTLQYLKHYGFKTFSPVINEDYDQQADPLTRMQMIVQEMSRIANLNAPTKSDLYANLDEIAKYNKQRFFSAEFHDLIVNEFQTNFDNAVEIMEQNKTGAWYKELGEIASLHPEMGRYYNKPKPGRTQQDLDDFYNWINQSA